MPRLLDYKFATAVTFATILVPSLSVAQRQESRADLEAVWTTSCQQEVERRLRVNRPRAQEVEFLTDSMKEWQETDSETGVWGNGRIREAGRWESYVFRCLYNFRQGRLTTVDFNFQDPIGEPSPPRLDADQGAPWTAACKHVIHQKVRQAHPRSRSIRIDTATMKEWQESDSETGVSGGGEYVGPRGNSNRFIFRCDYNSDSHELTTSDWQVRE